MRTLFLRIEGGYRVLAEFRKILEIGEIFVDNSWFRR
jgi:hypothetical protein